MQTLTLEITEKLAGRRIQSLLIYELQLSKSLISRLKQRENGICLNSAPAKTIDLVSAGDVLCVEIGDSAAAPSWQTAELSAPNIVFEDEHILVIDKPAGMASHGHGRTVVSVVSSYLKSAIVHPVTRLDRGTSGLMLLAKNAYMTERFRRLLHTDDFVRGYLALACGDVLPQKGRIDFPIAKSPDSHRRIISPEGRSAQTDYEVLKSANGMSLLKLRLHTGRTHQIRVHMAGLGFPLLGDALYGDSSPLIARCALHSSELRIKHPLTQEILELNSKLPSDMNLL